MGKRVRSWLRHKVVRIDVDRLTLAVAFAILGIVVSTLAYGIDVAADLSRDAERKSSENAVLIADSKEIGKAVQFNTAFLRCIALKPTPRTEADAADCDQRARASVERTERMSRENR
jgi:hypothetical protein